MQDDVRDTASQISQEESEQIAQQFREKGKSKGSIGVVVAIALVLILVGVGGYVFISRDGGDGANPTPTNTPTIAQETPTPVSDPYEGWQTYESEEFGFSFRYPRDWKIQSEEETDTTVFAYVSDKEMSLENAVYGVDGMTIQFFLKEDKSTLKNRKIGYYDEVLMYDIANTWSRSEEGNTYEVVCVRHENSSILDLVSFSCVPEEGTPTGGPIIKTYIGPLKDGFISIGHFRDTVIEEETLELILGSISKS